MSTADLYSLLIPMVVIPLCACGVVIAAICVRGIWDSYKARKRAEGSGG